MDILHRKVSECQSHAGKREEENREVSNRIDTPPSNRNETDAGFS